MQTITVKIGGDKTVDLQRSNRIYVSDSACVADSREQVHNKKGIITLPSYGVAIARAIDANNDDLWNTFQDVGAEQLRARATKSYTDASKGEDLRIFIIGASSFSHDTEAMRSFVQGKGILDGNQNVGLANFSVPLSQTQVDKVLGDRVVYVTEANGTLREHKVDKIMTYDEFLEASQGKDFLAQQGVYIGKFSEQEINGMKSGYLHIDSSDVRNHKTSIVLSGGRDYLACDAECWKGKGVL